MPLTSITHGYVSHEIDGTTFPAFSLWKAAEWVAQLTHRLNLPRSPLIGDEIHFLFECPKLEDLRIKYMTLGDRMRPNVYNFVHMLQDNDLGTIYSLAKFVFYGFEIVCSMFRLRFDFLDLMFMNESV